MRATGIRPSVFSSRLLAQHLEIGRGLDIAREHGVADMDDGKWIVGDRSRLERG